MPAWTPRPNRRLPASLARFRRLPQSKITRRILLVLIHIHARAVRDAVQILLAQLAVLREGRQPKIPRPVLCFVRCSCLSQPLHQIHHARNMPGSPGQNLRPLNLQRIQIVKKGLLELRRVFPDRHTRRRRIADDLVIHVRNVHHMADAHPLQVQEPPQHIHLQKGAEVPDMPVVVDRRPTGIHAQFDPIHGSQFVQLSAEGIKEAKSHREKACNATGNTVRMGGLRPFRLYQRGWGINCHLPNRQIRTVI